MVALRAQQAGAAGGGAAVASAPVAGSSVNEASSFGPAVDQGHKSLAEMRQERQVHPNMESVFRRTYSSPSVLPSEANSAAKDGLERGFGEDNLAHCTLFCILHFAIYILHCVHGKFTKWHGSTRSALLAKQCGVI